MSFISLLSLVFVAACAADDAPAEVPVPVVETPVEVDLGLGVDDIVRLDEAGLDALFADGQAPRANDMLGDLRGQVLRADDLAGEDLVVQGVRGVLDAGDYQAWLKKSFAPAGSGENLYSPYDRELRTAGFTYGVGVSRADGKPALLLDYARHDNLFLLWGVKEELRVVGRGIYLGRSYFETGAGRTPLFHFLLTRS
jgi:hypothetical protein